MTYRAWCFSGAAALMSILLAACGGGGGGGDAPGGGVVTPPVPPPPTTIAFTRWSSVTPGTAVVASGKALETTYALDGGRIAVATPGPVSDASFTQTTSPAAVPVSLQIAAPGGTVGFSTASGDSIGGLATPTGVRSDIIAARASGSDRQALAFNPSTRGYDFEYQSFGVWETGIGSNAGRIGAISVGAPTPAASLPSSGASFFGAFLGIYVDTAGVDHGVTATALLSFNFNDRIGQFNTTGMKDLATGAWRSDINVSGKIGLVAGQNLVVGDLMSSTDHLRGRLTGQFFGPQATEFGGLITMAPWNSNTSERLIGSFGMTKR